VSKGGTEDGVGFGEVGFEPDGFLALGDAGVVLDYRVIYISNGG
jgi:hypothetical protein